MGEWHKLKDALPATRAHNDFNQRNVGFRTGALSTAVTSSPPRSRNGYASGHGIPTAPRRRPNGGFARRLLPQIKALSSSTSTPAAAVSADHHPGVGGHALPGARANTESDIVVLDWETAQRNTAARDLVELLTFVLPPNTERDAIDRHVETHRDALIKAGVSTGVERDEFFEGFRCELKVQAINRVGLQLLFGAQFQLAYLTRINATIERLLDLYE